MDVSTETPLSIAQAEHPLQMQRDDPGGLQGFARKLLVSLTHVFMRNAVKTAPANRMALGQVHRNRIGFGVTGKRSMEDRVGDGHHRCCRHGDIASRSNDLHCGRGGRHPYIGPLTAATVMLLAIVCFSYRQTIAEYPAASKNLY